MSRMGGVMAAIVLVLTVEIAMVMTGHMTIHVVPGGVTLFAVVGAVALVRVAKLLGAVGVQQPVPHDHDE